MSRNKSDKRISSLESEFESILVCNDRSLRPYIEIFVFEPENATQKSLGTFFGIFEVADTSEDSSYIVNYLSSVIKKEYFSRPKRSPIESFEAALHKSNLALSKLAEHGNVKWLGKFNALVAIIEKNNLHIAQAGTASAFLFRSGGLTDISEGLSSDDPEPHPLKTFVNVSSGKLEVQDKLIIATESIFDIFSFEEIKKSLLRFSEEKFIQFLKTALGNELEKAAVLVVDIKKKKETPVFAQVQESEQLNAFSQEAFFRKPRMDNSASEITQEKISREIADEINKGQKEFISEKNGHIYLKESAEEHLENKIPNEFLMILTEKIGMVWESLKKGLKKLGLFIIKSIKKVSLLKINPRSAMKFEDKPAEKFVSPKSSGFNNLKNYAISSWRKIKNLFISENRTWIGAVLHKLKNGALVFIPNFSKIKNIIFGLNYQQKLYAGLIILAIIFVPFFGLKLSAYIQSKKVKTVEPVAEIIIPLERDKNVQRPENLNSLYSSNNLIGVLNLGGKFFNVSQANVTDLESKTEFPIPGDFGQIKMTTAMDDLNLIFLLNDKKQIVSFSPVSKKFQTNNIAIPENSNISAIGTYMTYLYLVDSANNKIYRYPRAEGGFGEKVDWLKDTLDLSQTAGIALSDNIFVADNKIIIKLFKGQRQDFNLETTATPIKPFKIYTNIDSQNIYILDKENSRLVKIDLTGNIISQYYNAELANANNFTIDETAKTAYISTSTDIKSFSIN